MRKNVLFLCLVALMFAAVGCGEKPETVAENFLTALDNKDFEKAKTFSTEGTHKMLDFLSGFAKDMPDTPKPEPKKVTKCAVDGDKATCTYCCDDEGGESELAMVKVDGKWKADMSKETLMGGEGGLDALGDEPSFDDEVDMGDEVPADLDSTVTDSTATEEGGM